MKFEMQKSFGLFQDQKKNQAELDEYVRLKLYAMGLWKQSKSENNLAAEILKIQFEKEANSQASAVDERIENFLKTEYPEDFKGPIFPRQTFELDRHGLARTLSLPKNGNYYANELLESYRIKQGVLHNPRNDKRTTQGVFHIAEGGMPIQADKLSVPKPVFAKMLKAAFNAPKSALKLPYTAEQDVGEAYVSLYLNPIVVPEIPGIQNAKRMEVRFFAPGGLVSNLDFVESIFGNAGSPHLFENDLGLDPENFVGVTGCVILAPHLTKLNKKDLGLPHISEATELQKKQGMCWKEPTDLYNNGSAFKICHRTKAGVMVTIIADNYYGYCKKEVKTQIGFAANIIGNAEEEHAGGALAFASFSWGEYFAEDERVCPPGKFSFNEVKELYGDLMNLQPEGYGIDKKFPDIVYVPEDVRMDITTLTVSWEHQGKTQTIKLLPTKTYVHPSGYKVQLKKHPNTEVWHLVGTVSEGTVLHKPSTVSGGGKSEISKPISDVMIHKNFYVHNLKEELDQAEEILNSNAQFGKRFKDPVRNQAGSTRPVLSKERSLGSVIRLFTPSNDYTDEYNTWLENIPYQIKILVFLIKRSYRPDWDADWKKHFSVDEMDGVQGNELMYKRRKLVTRYLRVGTDSRDQWKTFRVRQDFMPSVKIQMEDDITASSVIPTEGVKGLNEIAKRPSMKFVNNCEYRLFQRPDEAIEKGIDKQTEADFARGDLFVANYAPLSAVDAQNIIDDVTEFEKFSEPAKALISEAAQMAEGEYFSCSAFPRIVDGKPTKNPRYLQTRPDLLKAMDVYLAEMGSRMHRGLDLQTQVLRPVNSILIGHRNNPADHKEGIKALAIYNPLHYQELPELMMDFIATLSGKSPSTTGFGCEGAMTKGPFNAIRSTADLNAALVTYALTQDAGFSTAAGYVGPNCRLDHDISFLIPEIWCRMSTAEKNPQNLIADGCLEKVPAVEWNGLSVDASRLGYRMTAAFVHKYAGRIFANPNAVFSTELLKPELQSAQDFVEGMKYIADSHQEVALDYINDGSITEAVPPLKAILEIMAYGKSTEGYTLNSPELRKMFEREEILNAPWYLKRLETKQQRDLEALNNNKANIEKVLSSGNIHNREAIATLKDRLAYVEKQIVHTQSKAYIESLKGTIGADPM